MFLENYFDSAKRKLGLRSDAQLARHLGILPQDIITAKRKGYLRDDVMLKLCEIVEVPREEVAAAREAEKAPEGSEMRDVWRKAHETLKRASAVLGIGAVFIAGTVSNDARANAVQHIDIIAKTEVSEAVIKITGNWRRRLRHFFLRFFSLGVSAAAI